MLFEEIFFHLKCDSDVLLTLSAKKSKMTEEFLHYIWQYRLFDKNIETTDGQEVSVVHPGYKNTDAGPDFFQARIKIGDQLWAGNVEIHIRASDWFLHQHQNDRAYSNIILHIVFENDQPVFDGNGQPVATLELNGKFSSHLFNKYQAFLYNKTWIPCSADVATVDELIWQSWLERLLVERIERKSTEIKRLLNLNLNDWEETFYQVLAGSFGFKVNEQSFLLLAKSLPISVLAKHKNNLFQLEALLFGQAGLLKNDFADDYPQLLAKEYNFMKKKFSLNPIPGHLWKFLRLRPSNFPTIRISQFAALVHQSQNLVSKILRCKTSQEVISMFDLKASEYWETHYVFDKPAPKSVKRFGDAAIQTIVINTVVHFLFLYGNEKGNNASKDKAIEFLTSLPPEQNNIIQGFEKLGVKAHNAFETQALIELKNKYCALKKCLHCRVGLSLLRQNVS